MKLTIAIPTYNRNEIFKKNLMLLLPQLTADCQLLIIDNSSDKPVEEDLKDILINFNNNPIKIIRNHYNIGLTGNIIRCFELCEDPWLWILGDDDEVKEGAIEQIFIDIKKYKDIHFINYAWDAPSFLRKDNITTRGIDDFIDNFETLGVVLFISAGIYNTKKITNYLSFGNFFQTTYAPHLAMLFLSIGNEGCCVLSHKQIVINKGFDTPEILRWDQIFIYQMTILLRLPLSPSALFKLKKKLEQLTRVWTITHLIFTLVQIGSTEKSTKRTLILYDDIVRSFFYLDKRLISKVIIIIGYTIVKYPFLFNPLLQSIYKIKRGKSFKSITNLRI
jgi:glycosyltransferase involved in cell wall biosynthesis